jgi:5-methylcytosine-specific restriction endonuclease McrA
MRCKQRWRRFACSVPTQRREAAGVPPWLHFQPFMSGAAGVKDSVDDQPGLAGEGSAPGSEEPGALDAGERGRPSSSRVLVLNSSYEPLNVCTVRRAVVLVLKEKAEMLETGSRELRSESMTMPHPVVIRLITYVRVPRDSRRRRITRRAVFARDSWTCQYCGRTSHLTVDHVLPRSRGGTSGPKSRCTRAASRAHRARRSSSASRLRSYRPRGSSTSSRRSRLQIVFAGLLGPTCAWVCGGAASSKSRCPIRRP